MVVEPEEVDVPPAAGVGLDVFPELTVVEVEVVAVEVGLETTEVDPDEVEGVGLEVLPEVRGSNGSTVVFGNAAVTAVVEAFGLAVGVAVAEGLALGVAVAVEVEVGEVEASGAGKSVATAVGNIWVDADPETPATASPLKLEES